MDPLTLRRADLGRWVHEPERPALPDAGLVDAHVHLFPPRVLEAIWAWFGEHAWPIRYRLHADEALRFLQAQGVERVYGLHYAHRPGMARVLNAFITEVAASWPMVIPFGTVLPGEPDAAAVVTESLDAMGHAGLKLHCHVQKLAPDDAVLFPVYEAAEARGKPIVLHAGREPSSPAYGFDCRGSCGIDPVRRVVERFPRLKLIVPHLGADQWREFVALCRGSDNLYLDTTMAVSGYLTDDTPTLADVEPIAHRLLFGTDFPNIPYAWGRERDWLLGLGLAPGALREVARGNALRLAGLPDGD